MSNSPRRVDRQVVTEPQRQKHEKENVRRQRKNLSRERTLREEMWGEIQYTYHSDSGRTTSRVDRSGLAAKSMVSI